MESCILLRVIDYLRFFMLVEFFPLLLGKKTHFYVDLVDLPLKLSSNYLEINKKMWGLLLSVVFVDMFSMSSSLGSVLQIWSKTKKKKTT